MKTATEFWKEKFGEYPQDIKNNAVLPLKLLKITADQIEIGDAVLEREPFMELMAAIIKYNDKCLVGICEIKTCLGKTVTGEDMDRILEEIKNH